MYKSLLMLPKNQFYSKGHLLLQFNDFQCMCIDPSLLHITGDKTTSPWPSGMTPIHKRRTRIILVDGTIRNSQKWLQWQKLEIRGEVNSEDHCGLTFRTVCTLRHHMSESYRCIVYNVQSTYFSWYFHYLPSVTCNITV